MKKKMKEDNLEIALPNINFVLLRRYCTHLLRSRYSFCQCKSSKIKITAVNIRERC